MNLFETIKDKILDKETLSSIDELNAIFIKTNFFVCYADEFLASVLAEDFSEDQYDIIHMFSWFVFVERSRAKFGFPKKHDIPEKYFKIQEFMYEWDVFGSKRIKWDEWSDIAQEGIDVLKYMMTLKGRNYQSTARYADFMEKVSKRLGKIVRSGDYDDEFREWGKDG